ncbi:MAG: MFS transporter, partial [Pseudomonadota bacterium]
CISGTVQKCAAGKATLAFAIFYMVINIGSLFGRFAAYEVRTRSSLSMIFAVAAVCAASAFFVVLFLYRDPDKQRASQAAPAKPRRSIAVVLLDMFLVLRNLRFTLFLLVSGGFFFLYAQVYNVLPLYLKKVVEGNPPIDIYTAANPLVIVAFQLLITKLFGRLPPIRSIIVGTVLISLAMLINLYPLFSDGVSSQALSLLPLGSLFIVMTVALVAFGELFTSARSYEYIGALAPKGQEGLFLGYASLPMAIGAAAGNPVGAVIFNKVMCRGATMKENGLLELRPNMAAAGWLILTGVGLVTAFCFWLFDRWLRADVARSRAAALIRR